VSIWGRRFEWVLFCLLCGVVALAPMVAHVLLLSLPNAGGWLGSVWLNGIYLSWAFLIYFSWAFLPGMQAPFRERMRGWVVFLVLELAYPVLSWGLEGDSRVYLAVDVFSYVSTCVAVGAAFVLLREGTENAWEGGVLLALVATLFCILLPGVVGEVAWWQQVELPGDGWMGPVLRAGGVGMGVTGVVRNLRASEIF
jgi:hypothetical protein